VHLLFVGEVEEGWFGHLTKILSESQMGGFLPLRVHVFGRKASKEEIISLYQACDVLILNSICEAFGKVIIEGLSLRVPVLARDCGGPSEILTHNTTGLLHDSGKCKTKSD
jgi:glycosyltransferase involved in cell wall biosynthesis